MRGWREERCGCKVSLVRSLVVKTREMGFMDGFVFLSLWGRRNVWKMGERSHRGDRQEAPLCAAQGWALTEDNGTWDGALGIGVAPC